MSQQIDGTLGMQQAQHGGGLAEKKGGKWLAKWTLKSKMNDLRISVVL